MNQKGFGFKFKTKSKLLKIGDLDPAKIQVEVIDLDLSKKIGQMTMSAAMKKFR